jgi:hypothetical protein
MFGKNPFVFPSFSGGIDCAFTVHLLCYYCTDEAQMVHRWCTDGAQKTWINYSVDLA